MQNISSQRSPFWIVGGDFNTYLSVDKHIGTSLPYLPSLEEFVDCVRSCELIDLPYEGLWHTWVGGRGLGVVKRRLDCVLCSAELYDHISGIKVVHLPRVSSDHAPLLLSRFPAYQQGSKSFRFLNV